MARRHPDRTASRTTGIRGPAHPPTPASPRGGPRWVSNPGRTAGRVRVARILQRTYVVAVGGTVYGPRGGCGRVDGGRPALVFLRDGTGGLTVGRLPGGVAGSDIDPALLRGWVREAR